MSDMNTEVVEETVVADEVAVDHPVDEFTELETMEESPETEGDAEVEETPEVDDILEWVNSQNLKVDGEEFKYESRDDLLNDARTARTVPRLKEQRDKYKNDPGLKFMNDYMKESGYKDMTKFVHDLTVQRKVDELVAANMDEEKAKAYAEEYVKNLVPAKDPLDAEIGSFLEWHETKFGEGLKEAPQVVIDALNNGESAKEAYLEYRLDNAKVETEQKTIEKLRKNKEKSAGEIDKSKPTNNKMTVSQIDKTLNNLSSAERSKWIKANYDKIVASGYYD